MSFPSISPYKTDCSSNDTSVLLIGAEGTSKHDIAKCLVEMGTAISLKMHTCCGLPLPSDSDLYTTNVQFVILVFNMASKHSLKVLADSLSQLDVTYFMGRAVIVANTKSIISNTKGHGTDECVPYTEVKSLAAHYDLPVLYTNTEIDTEKIDVGRKLLRQIEASVGWRPNVTPLLYDAVRECDNTGETISGDFWTPQPPLTSTPNMAVS